MQSNTPSKSKALAWEVRRSRSNCEKPTVVKALERLSHHTSGELELNTGSAVEQTSTSSESRARIQDLFEFRSVSNNNQEEFACEEPYVCYPYE